MADQLMTYKYVVRNVAKRAGKTATFMPKPVFGDNGSGMQLPPVDLERRQDIDGGRVRLRRAVVDRGLLRRGTAQGAPALLAFAAPTTNSYRRLVPGFEAPVNLVYSQRNRSACVRIPVYRLHRKPNGSSSVARTRSPTLTSLSRRCCSQASTGSRRASTRGPLRLRPVRGGPRRRPAGARFARRDARRARGRPRLPAQGRRVQRRPDQTWIDWKREQEVDPLRLRPHPLEFALYYDA